MDLKEKQIIYIDNKPHIKCNVVMLPTKNESSLWINCENKLKIHIKDRMCPGKQEFQHLYITSNGKLNKDEWYCSPIGIVSRYNGIEKLPSNWRKIIATTDTSLKTTISPYCFPEGGVCASKDFHLPQPSKEFLEAYVKAYNEGNPITEVMVEYDKKWINSKGIIGDTFTEIALYEESIQQYDACLNNILKVKSDNTISIRKVKDSYSKNELLNFVCWYSGMEKEKIEKQLNEYESGYR